MANELNLAQVGTLPPELYEQQQQLNRQQQFANLLMQQGTQQPQGQMVSGRYVAPSWTQQLAPVVGMLTGAYMAKQGDTKASELAKEIRKGKAEAEENIIKDITGYDKTTELAGPYTGNVPMPTAVQKVEPNLAEALRKIRTNEYGAGKEYVPTILKQMMPDPTELERNYKAAQKQGYTGTIVDYKNMMTEAQKEENRIARARLGLAAQEQAFNLGLPMGGAGGGAPSGQAPLQTIAPGSPILAPGQQPTMQLGVSEAMPRFTSKAQQDIWVATQKEKGKLQAEAQNALPGALQTVQSGLEAINGMIGDTTVDKNGKLVYGKTQPHPGFSGAVGISGIGSGFGAAGFIPGTDVKDFQSRFKQVEGQAFLGAINTLRGTGAISEVEGAKATAALNRMSLSQSEAEFVKAANEFKDVLQKGYAAAQQRAGVLPVNVNAQPSIGGSSPRYVYDPATGTLK